MNLGGTQFVDTALGGLGADDDKAVGRVPNDRHTAAMHAARLAATRLRKRAEFLDLLASYLPEDMSILGPKAYDALMQFIVDASR